MLMWTLNMSCCVCVYWIVGMFKMCCAIPHSEHQDHSAYMWGTHVQQDTIPSFSKYFWLLPEYSLLHLITPWMLVLVMGVSSCVFLHFPKANTGTVAEFRSWWFLLVCFPVILYYSSYLMLCSLSYWQGREVHHSLLQLRWLVTGLSPPRPQFSPKVVHVRFWMCKLVVV